jgi:threonine dehydrogenase-like Zn-dependent dehydrogenase
MRGIWVQDGKVELRTNLPVPEPPPGWARIKVDRAGICGTDLQIIDGYAGFRGVLGHEFVGRVDSGSSEWTGKRVVGSINVGCDSCAECLEHGPHHCRNRRVLGIRDLDGAFADFLVLPESNLHEVPPSITDAAAAFVEPLAAAIRVAEQLDGADRSVLIVGAGRLGQLVARVLAATGREPTVLCRHAEQVARLEPLGIPTLTEPPATRFGAVVDCAGTGSGLRTALAATRPRGLLIVKSSFADSPRLDMQRVVVDEIRIQGSRCGAFAPAIEMLDLGRVQVEDLVTRTMPLDEGRAALRQGAESASLKIQLEI